MFLAYLYHWLQLLSQRTGIQIDQINFVFCMLLNLPLGLIFRVTLHPRRVSKTVRLTTGVVWGLAITWFCFGSQLLNVLAVVTLCYTLTRLVDPTVVHRYVFIAAFGTLSAAQVHRIIVDYGNNSVDYILVLMLMTQRFTYAAFSVHDGLGREENTLSEEQKRQQLKKIPSVLEYFAYMFHYSMLLAGPTITFKDYMDFIEGKDLDPNQNKEKNVSEREPSPVKAAMRKLAESFLYVSLFLALGGPNGIFAILPNTDPAFADRHSFLWRVIYSHISIVVYRLRYYIAWSMTTSVNTIAGLGFNGYDEKGRPLWNRYPCVYITKTEGPKNIKMIVDNWNIFTVWWLRRTVLDRVTKHRALCVYTVSALWHGFYPGYYMCAFSVVLASMAERTLRRAFRPVVEKLSSSYDPAVSFIGWLWTITLLAYHTLPFYTLRFDLGYQYYRSQYFYGHILCVAIIILFRLKPFGRNGDKLKSKELDINGGSRANDRHVTSTHIKSNGLAGNIIKSKGE